MTISEVVLLRPEFFKDERGHFFESYNRKNLEKALGYAPNFVQDNHSTSSAGVLRGLHFQKPPWAQGKLVRVIEGEIFDVAVDIRPDSPTRGQWVGERLTAENRKQLWIPEGFAHGFLVLSSVAQVLYKTTNYYAPKAEGCLIYNDPEIQILWPEIQTPIKLSKKDTRGVNLSEIR